MTARCSRCIFLLEHGRTGSVVAANNLFCCGSIPLHPSRIGNAHDRSSRDTSRRSILLKHGRTGSVVAADVLFCCGSVPLHPSRTGNAHERSSQDISDLGGILYSGVLATMRETYSVSLLTPYGRLFIPSNHYCNRGSMTTSDIAITLGILTVSSTNKSKPSSSRSTTISQPKRSFYITHTPPPITTPKRHALLHSTRKCPIPHHQRLPRRAGSDHNLYIRLSNAIQFSHHPRADLPLPFSRQDRTWRSHW